MRIRFPLSPSALTLIEFALSYRITEESESHEFLLRCGVPADDENLVEAEMWVNTMRNTLAAIKGSSRVIVEFDIDGATPPTVPDRASPC